MVNLGITGGTGTIGFQFIKSLLKGGDCKHILVLVEKERVPYRSRLLHQIKGDIFRIEAVETLCKKNDVIFHLAAKNPYFDNIPTREYAEFLAVDALGTAVTSRLVEEYDKRLIFPSSVAVYTLNPTLGKKLTEKTSLPKSQETMAWIQKTYEFLDKLSEGLVEKRISSPQIIVKNYLEENPVPINENIYAVSKYLAELFVKRMNNSVLLRFSDVYGPGDETPKMTPVLIRSAHEGKEMVWFDGRNQYCPVYLGDVLKALNRSATLSITPENKILNVTCNLVGPLKLMQSIKECVGSNSVISESYQEADLEPALDFSNEKAKDYLEIDFTPLKVGLSKSVEYYKLPKKLRNLYVISDGL